MIATPQQFTVDNVTYAEIRTGLKDLGSGNEGYLKSVLRGVQRGCEKTNLKADIVLSLRRDSNGVVAQETLDLVKKYKKQGVVGLDVYGDIMSGDGKDILAVLHQAHQEHISVTLHLGELPKETPEQQMKELEVIQPKRIGHAIFLCPEAVTWIRTRKIPVELCLTSAIKAKHIQESWQYPVLQLMFLNHPVVIATDDPLLFKTTLSEECVKVAQVLNLSQEAMVAMQVETRNYRF